MRTILTALALACSMALYPAAVAADDVPDPFREYKGKEPVPDALRLAYTGFVRHARSGSVASHLLPHAVTTSQKPRPADQREYGDDINEDFLKNGFSPEVRVIRKEEDDCYLLRTGSTAIWFVQTKSGVWKVYRYRDKPIR